MSSFKITISFLDASEETLTIESTNTDHYQTIIDYIEEKRGHKNIDLVDEDGDEFVEGDETERDITLVCIIKNTCVCCSDSPDRLYDEKCAECWISDNADSLMDVEEYDDYTDYSLGVVNYRESITLKYRVYFDEDGEQDRVEKVWNRMWNGNCKDDIEKVEGVLMVGSYDRLIMSSELPEDAGDDIMGELTTIYKC
jgi:hypothetical protein